MNRLGPYLLIIFLLGFFGGCGNWFLPQQYELTVYQWGEGEVSPSKGTHNFEQGATVDLKAEAGTGWEFKEWQGPVEDPLDPETSILMEGDQTVLAHFEDPYDLNDYLGLEEGTLFVYDFFHYYEDHEEEENLGPLYLEVIEVEDNQIEVEITNEEEFSETIIKEDNSYHTLDFIFLRTLLDEYPISLGFEGYEILLPASRINDPLVAVGKEEWEEYKAWKFYGPDRVLADYWDDDPPTEELKEVTVLIVPYKGLIKQEMVFDKDSQNGKEKILERSVIKLDRIIEP